MQNKETIVNLLYNFYRDVLELFEGIQLEHYLSQDSYKKYKSRDSGFSIVPADFLNIIPKRFYDYNKGKIFKLRSFEKIIEYIKKEPKILNSDKPVTSSPKKENIGKKSWEVEGLEVAFGWKIFSLAGFFFNLFNRPYFHNEIEWDFNPVEFKNFALKIREDDCFSILCGERFDKKILSYDYFLLNFEIEGDRINILSSPKIYLKRLTDKEKELMINSKHWGFIDLEWLSNCKLTTLCSSEELKRNELDNYLSLLRVFKKGDFRYFAYGALRQEIVTNTIGYSAFFTLGNEGSLLNEESVICGLPLTSPDPYNISRKERYKLKSFINSNFDRIKANEFNFATKILNQIHTLQYEFRIPYLFFILESLFGGSGGGISYRIKTLIAKILGEKYEFTDVINKLYEIRCKIVHGSNIKKKDFKDLKYNDQKISNIEECSEFLEDVTRKIWKKFLKCNFKSLKDIEKEYF